MRRNVEVNAISERLEKMLINDKVQAPDGFAEVLKGDLKELLKDYFDLNDELFIDINLTENSDFEINIHTSAQRIKSFNLAN